MIEDRAKKIKLLISDIDGVMTDGRIVYDNYGDELKFFDVQDGFGVSLLRRAGIKFVIVTAKGSRLVKKRGRELSAAAIYQKAWDKAKAYKKIVQRFKLKNEEICAIGDDLLDVPILRQVGLAVAVENAVDETKQAAHYVTKKSGGRGAVREVIELIIKSQGKWDEVTNKYLSTNRK